MRPQDRRGIIATLFLSNEQYPMAESNGAANGQQQSRRSSASRRSTSRTSRSRRRRAADLPGPGEPAERRAQPLAARDAARRVRVRGRAECDRDLQDRGQDRLSRRSASGRHLRSLGLRPGRPRRGAAGRIARTCCSRMRARSFPTSCRTGVSPPFFLQPINFDALYADQQRRRAEGTGADAGANA